VKIIAAIGGGMGNIMERLQKFLADCGVASRRKAEQLILDGRITVNGQVITELGVKIDPSKDEIEFDHVSVKRKTACTYIMLHKPEGYITTTEDQFSRPSVLDLLGPNLKRLYPIGRLDYNTSGLLILTNDGDLTYKLTHPKHNVAKTYIAKIIGTPTADELGQFRSGLIIDDYKTAPAKIEIIKKDIKYVTLKIAIKEGRNRQVRKMLEKIGYRTVALKRVATGKLFLGELKRGEHRSLTPAEVDYLKNL